MMIYTVTIKTRLKGDYFMFNLTKEQDELAKTLHESSVVVDTHNDTILHLIKAPPFVGDGTRTPPPRRTLRERSSDGQIDIPRIREGGVDCLLFAMYVSPLHRARLHRLIQLFDAFHTELQANHDSITLATNYNEIMATVKAKKIAAVITIEGGEPLEGDLGALRMVYRLGARSLTLTHFPRNELGDGSGADSGSHLSNFGREVVEEMNRLGMIVDISHLNETGFWDVMELSKDPVLATHSNCKALCNHHRNLTDDQIKALAEKGGVMNLSFCAGFIKEGIGFDSPEDLSKVTIEDWLDHLDHAVGLVGSDYVGIGSDLDGGCGFPGLDDITKFPDLTRGMVSRGYSNDEIKKILGTNDLRVIKKVLK
jgi:membrane dipeptidase